MIEYLVAICLLLLTLGHAILIHGCMKWAVERKQTTALIDDRIATLCTLLDEGLDLLAGTDQPVSPITHTAPDLRSTLMSMLMSKVMPADLDSNASEEQTWTVQQDEETKEQPLQEGS